MSTSRATAVFLAALMLAHVATFVAPTGESQGSSDVPVPYQSALSKMTLHFTRHMEDPEPFFDESTDPSESPCNDQEATRQATQGGADAVCSLRPEAPPKRNPANPNVEIMNVRNNAEGSPDPASVARFIMDTNSRTALTTEGATSPFTIKKGSNALKVGFWYDSDATCDPVLTGAGQTLTFHISVFRASATDLNTGEFDDEVASTTRELCNLPMGTLGDNQAHFASAGMDLDSPKTIAEDQFLVLEIFAVSNTANLQWTLLFEDATYDSTLEIRTDQAVERALWATDKGGTVKETFDPQADTDQRFMVGHMALRSPFGGDAVPAQGFSGEIIRPDGTRVDFDPGTNTLRKLDMVEDQTLRKKAGAVKIFKFDHPSGIAEQPWHYPKGVETGSYTLRVSGEILGNDVQLTRGIAMGAFALTLAPVQGENEVHQLKRDSSTTFLLRLTNGASVRDTFEVKAAFSFASRDLVWSVGIGGVDRNDRISLDPGETTLLTVKLTPPSEARSGDAARLSVTATSLGSQAKQSVNLEGQITSQTVRDVGFLVLRPTAFPVGIDQTTRIQAFAWNKGTATDSLTASIVEGSLSPDNPNKFRVQLSQSRFDNVAPGDVVPIPIDVTTTNQVLGGDTFDFRIQVKSVALPDEVAEGPVNTVVEALRGFDLFALNGRDDRAIKSERWGKWNMSDVNATDPRRFCERNPTIDFPEECGEYTRYIYHRFTLTNTGNQPETFQLRNTTALFNRPTTACSITLDERLVAEDIIGTIDHENPGTESSISQLDVDPGETKRFYFRLVVLGHRPVYESPAIGSACTWEEHLVSIQASSDGLPTKSRQASTKMYQVRQIQDLPSQAQARLAVSERSVSAADSLTFSGLPDIVSVQPSATKEIGFTASLQAGHEDRLKLTVGPSNKVTSLRDAGWEIELVPAQGIPFNESEDGDGILIPASDQFSHERERSTAAENEGGDRIGHATGADFPMILKVTPPATGLQENERHTLSVRATSVYKPGVNHDLGIDLQVGEDFAFELSAQPQTVQAHPGDTVAFGLTVENTGASRDTYRIAPQAGGALPQPTAQPSTLSVSPLSSKSVSIQVNVPDGTQQGEHTLPVIVRSDGDPNDPDDDLEKEITLTVDVRPPGTLRLTAEDPLVQIGPRGNQTINFTLENTGSEAVTARFSQVSAPPGWTTTLGNTTTVTVGAGDSTTFPYLITAPANIVEGSRYVFVLKAQDINDASNFANGHAFAVVESQAAVSLEPEATTTVVDRGGSSTLPVLVRNLGTGPTWFRLSTQFQSQGWSSTILDQDRNTIENRTVLVPEKTFKRVLVQVKAPTDVAKGHVETVRLTASGLGQTATDQVVLTAEIHDFGLAINVTGPATKDAAPGDNTEFELSVTNTGNGRDRVQLSFEDPSGGDAEYLATTDLSDDLTPELAAGETLSGITVSVAVPSPNQGPVPTPDGVSTVIRATSQGTLPSGGAPTVATEVKTKLVPYVRFDVDDDGAFEVALDMNRNTADGFEVFADRDQVMIQRGEIGSEEAVESLGLFAIDPDGDGRSEHLVDTDDDGIANIYFDPDRAQTSGIPYTLDVNRDNEPETPIDSDFDGLIDKVFNPPNSIWEAVNLDFSGDGRRDLLLDTNGDGVFDTFVDPNQDPHVVTEVTKKGDRYHLDTNGDGKIDTFYNAQTQSIEDATSANLKDFLGDYWYFIVLFALVLVLFAVIVVRRI